PQPTPRRTPGPPAPASELASSTKDSLSMGSRRMRRQIRPPVAGLYLESRPLVTAYRLPPVSTGATMVLRLHPCWLGRLSGEAMPRRYRTRPTVVAVRV